MVIHILKYISFFERYVYNVCTCTRNIDEVYQHARYYAAHKQAAPPVMYIRVPCYLIACTKLDLNLNKI